MRRQLSPILLLVVLVVAFLIARGQVDTATYVSADNLYFTDNMAVTGASDVKTPMERALLFYLDGAKSAIDVAIYDFNRDSVRDALVAAHERGVTVRVVTDDETRFFNDSHVPYYLSLEQAGITVKDDERENSIMHNKYFVVDDQLVWTGSTNISDNGFSRNHNNSIVLTGTQVADVYLRDFDQMWAGDFSVAKTATPEQRMNRSGEAVEVYFSPKDDAMAKIIQEVERARTSIDFAIFFLTDDALRDALIAAHKRGVVVRGLWDRLGAESPFSGDEALCASGIPIRTEDTIGKMHNKMMVIDASGERPRVITGSMNWTGSGDRSNDENTVILRNAEAAGRYVAEFDEMWDTLGPGTECTQEGAVESTSETTMGAVSVPGEIRIVSIVFNPDGDDVAGEYVVVQNSGHREQNLADRTLRDESNNTYSFPAFALAAGGQGNDMGAFGVRRFRGAILGA